MSSPSLLSQEYGKEQVRLVKVFRDKKPWEEIVEYTIQILLEGEAFTKAYTHADNGPVVATDSMKNTVYVLAKKSEHARVPECFAHEIANHFLTTYAHVSRANILVRQHRWTRMLVKGSLHPHSFLRDGEEERVARVIGYRKKGGDPLDLGFDVTGGLEGLLVLKTTGSAFTGFVRDQYTTLPETDDRIFSTIVSAQWSYAPGASRSQVMSKDYTTVFDAVRETTLRIFAEDESASVQATLYRMGSEVVSRFGPSVQSIRYTLPNRHVVNLDLKPFGLDNLGKDATVYVPLANPSGLISATIGYKNASKL
ncbi:MAG: hypothetical protein DHS80DRAFT_30872 [Piptocephalis tieghemiana]|nr:MAG: hypothetical protein DHS80DRAFT_30872 [Piptocephalis tieghemiana]